MKKLAPPPPFSFAFFFGEGRGRFVWHYPLTLYGQRGVILVDLVFMDRFRDA